MEAQKGTRGTNLPEAKAIVHFCSQMLNYFDIILCIIVFFVFDDLSQSNTSTTTTCETE